MENSQNSRNPQNQANTNSNPQSSSGNQGSNRSSAQGRSSQQATSGMGGLQDIQDKLQQFGSATAQKVNSLSTTQKVVGGSLLALGAGWLALSSQNKNKIKNQANTLASTAKDRIQSKTNEFKSGNSGSSSTDARVK